MNITTFDDKQAIAIWFGEYLLKKSELSDKLLIALSGGSTPKVIFDELANNFSTKIEWKKIHFYWVDERIVPPTNEESNYKMTVDHLLSKIDIPEENIHRIKGELDAQQACYDYEDEILGQLPNANNLPCFDILLLGMGDDGHTASIFPHQIQLWHEENVCKVAQHPTSGQNRVTLTGKVINNAKEILFMVTGKDKTPKLKEIKNQTGNYQSYPANLVSPKAVWLIDKEAASGI